MSFICHIHNYTEYNEQWDVFSAFNPSKLEQWAADCAAPREQFGVSVPCSRVSPQSWTLPAGAEFIRFLLYCTYFTSCTIRLNLFEWPTPNPAPKPTSHWGLDKFVQIILLIKYVWIGCEIALAGSYKITRLFLTKDTPKTSQIICPGEQCYQLIPK